MHLQELHTSCIWHTQVGINLLITQLPPWIERPVTSYNTQVGVFKAGSAVVLVAEALHSTAGLKGGRFRFGVRAGERVLMGQRLDEM